MNARRKFDQQHFDSLYPKQKFSRRGFIASSLAAGFAVSAGPLMAQTAIKTPADGLDVVTWRFRWPAAICRSILQPPRKQVSTPRSS